LTLFSNNNQPVVISSTLDKVKNVFLVKTQNYNANNSSNVWMALASQDTSELTANNIPIVICHHPKKKESNASIQSVPRRDTMGSLAP
jgi:hypothetical protein